MAEPGISHQLKRQVLWLIVKDTWVKCPDPDNEFPDQSLELLIGLLVFLFVGVMPLPVIICA